MSRYIRYEEVGKMCLSMMGITNTEWLHVLRGVPSIEIIHCHECKAYDSECEWCGGLGLGMKPDDFCSYGSRSEKPNNSKVPQVKCGTCRYNKSGLWDSHSLACYRCCDSDCEMFEAERNE